MYNRKKITPSYMLAVASLAAVCALCGSHETLDDGVPVYVISLKSRPERLAACTAQLHGCDVRVIQAVDGRTLAMPTKTTSLTRGEVGCFLSHVAALQDIVAGESPMALVLEDDCVLRLPAQWPAIARAVAAAPAGWGALALGCNYIPADARSPAPGLIELGGADLYGTHAIMYTRAGAAAYLAAVRAAGFTKAYDTWLSRCRVVPLYVVNPPIATPRKGERSDTQGIR